ncbi:MAG: o-succinylbenzoate synthase [Bacteroidetes bacterium HGW-Bacteroidetes-17]|jgi:o-succinylbenzoate synthase|nr:MAG: o-succinylbenzoate synthase [Bacteroidetes bacterium HGW-Bacteroidetes-17]
MLQATITKHILNFKQASGTSRGVLHQKPSWFFKIFDDKNPQTFGLGECSIIPGLSPDDSSDLEPFIHKVSENINAFIADKNALLTFPSVQFAIETALLDLGNNGHKLLYPSTFTEGKDSIKINGLIWMGTKEFMHKQIREKIEEGYNCIKLKIGSLDFEEEISLLKEIRIQFSPEIIELRLDANGAFHPENALEKLKRLSEFQVHSIEQPIKAGQIEEMANLCEQTPIPIALDEELIGINKMEAKRKLLAEIKPQYIILKPSLLGGFDKSSEWIKIATEHQIGWWVTSALESNIGLNAIAQWTYQLNNSMPQGLGTGKLFSNNIPSPLQIKDAKLFYLPENNWNLNQII